MPTIGDKTFSPPTSTSVSPPPSNPTKNISILLIDTIESLAFVTFMSVSAIGVTGYIGGQAMGCLLIGSGSALFMTDLTDCIVKKLSIKILIAVAIINSLGLLTYLSLISPPITGSCILVVAGFVACRQILHK